MVPDSSFESTRPILKRIKVLGPLNTLRDDAPQFVKEELWKMSLALIVRSHLKSIWYNSFEACLIMYCAVVLRLSRFYFFGLITFLCCLVLLLVSAYRVYLSKF